MWEHKIGGSLGKQFLSERAKLQEWKWTSIWMTDRDEGSKTTILRNLGIQTAPGGSRESKHSGEMGFPSWEEEV